MGKTHKDGFRGKDYRRDKKDKRQWTASTKTQTQPQKSYSK